MWIVAIGVWLLFSLMGRGLNARPGGELAAAVLACPIYLIVRQCWQDSLAVLRLGRRKSHVHSMAQPQAKSTREQPSGHDPVHAA